MVELVIVTPHSWGRTQALKQRPSSAPRREQTAVEIFKSCGPAGSHASFPAAPSLHLPEAPPAQHPGFIATKDSGCQDPGARTAKPGPHPNQPHPPAPGASPTGHTPRGREGESRWAGRPCPRSSRPGPGIPSRGPSAVRSGEGWSRAARPRFPFNPGKRGTKRARLPATPNSRLEKGSF